MLAATLALGWVAALAAPVHAQTDPPLGRPDAIVDLGTREGMALVRGQWRYSDAQLERITDRGPGPDLKPSGEPIDTLDVVPHAGDRGFDDRAWEVIDPTTLEHRRSPGRVAFAWYRTRVTIPDRFGAVQARGATVALEVVLDDYAEVWVDGKLPRVLGQTGGNVVKGWGAPNRVILGRSVAPGQSFDVAIFAMNGPVSASPHNFIWMKSATLDVWKGPPATSVVVEGRVERFAPGLDAVVPRDVKFEKLADGFQFTEGPVWHPDGYLLFSDPNANVIWRWTPDGDLSVYRTKSGYRGLDVGEYHQPGSNGLAIDPQGRLTVDEHGNRRVTRIESNGVTTVLASGFEGRRLNSPNDLVYRSDGALFFTDPPFGLPRVFDDERKELAWSGVFAVVDGKTKLVTNELAGPNGIAFSPDERFLYVGNWDPKRKVIMRYEVRKDGSVAHASVFFDLTSAPGEEAIDGLKVDRAGNVYASGPGGLWIIGPDGRALGTLKLPEQPANFAWGDADARGLYVTARTGLYRVRLNVPGVRR